MLRFKVTAKNPVFDMEEFCQHNGSLVYIGRFAINDTSKVIGTIMEYNGKFYTNEFPGHSGIRFTPPTAEGMVTTSVELIEAPEYVPDDCKPVSSCSILIDIWELDKNSKEPISRYAFYSDQLDAAKEIVRRHEDVDIFVDGVQIDKNDFFEF